jgi:hypothetical protein
MLGLYYRIWVDCITRAKSRPQNQNNWPSFCMAFMSISMFLNLIVIMTLIQKHVIKQYFYYIKLDFLPKYTNNVVSGIILFVAPCVLLNYFLIFNKHRYKVLLQKYPSRYNGKLFLTYFLISLGLPFVLLFGGLILYKLGVIN